MRQLWCEQETRARGFQNSTVITTVAFATFLLVSSPVIAQLPMIELALGSEFLEGTPLAFNERQVVLLGRDGVMRTLDPRDAKEFRKTSDAFQSYSQAETRQQLMREFGQAFQVSGTGHFLVVHPAGQHDRWSQRFEDLYRSFVRYMTARGIQPQSLTFPLVAIVFPRREDFSRYAAANKVPLTEGMVGYYSPLTNRIAMYEIPAGDQDATNWQITSTTIIHEAAHQSAFNLGIHSRFAMPPRWVAEGLGTLFEAPGVYDSQRNFSRQDRINRRQLTAFLEYARQRRTAESLAELLSSDRPFSSRQLDAYAEAWALTFFLSETDPRRYADYLSKTASRVSFQQLRSPEILSEFTSVFGDDLAMLDARFLRFMIDLK